MDAVEDGNKFLKLYFLQNAFLTTDGSMVGVERL